MKSKINILHSKLIMILIFISLISVTFGCNSIFKSQEKMFHKAQLFQQTEKYDKAIRLYEIIVKKYPDNPLAEKSMLQLGICLSKKEKFDESIKICQEYLEKYPKGSDIAEVIGTIAKNYYNKQDYYNALQWFEKLNSTYPDFHRDGILCKIAACHMFLEEYEQSKDIFLKVIQDYPNSIYKYGAYHGLGVSYLNLTDLNKAKDVLNKIILECKEDDIVAAAYFTISEVKLKEGDTKSAYEGFKFVIHKYPKTKAAQGAISELDSNVYAQFK